MSIPSFQDFMRPVLRFLSDNKEHTAREILEAVSSFKEFNFKEQDWAEKTPQGEYVIFNRISWAQSYLTNAKLIERPRRAVYIISQRGRDALSSNAEINVSYLQQFKEFSYKQGKKVKYTATKDNKNLDNICYAEQDPIDTINQTINTLNTTLAIDLLDTIKKASPQFFERLVVDLMLSLGYGGSRQEAGETTRYTKDGGIDGIIKEDKLGLDTIYLQAKRYTTQTVGKPEIQSFVGALVERQSKKGVFITTSRFSADAQQYVSRITERVILIDGEKLTKLMIENNLGVAIKQRYEIKTIDFDYFDES